MNFYVLHDARYPRGNAVTDFSKCGDVTRARAPQCQSCGAFIGAMPWLPPYHAELEVWGPEYGDIAFGPGNELLITERTSTAFNEARLSGLSGFDTVNIAGVKRRGGSKLKSPPPRYCCVTIARSRAAIDLQASALVQDRPYSCGECRSGLVKRTKRICLEEGTWSGEDIFYARGLPGTILASLRFKEFFDANGINNGQLIDANEYSFDFYPWETKL